MNNDEFAFFNQQLAAMVRDGIPLETALRRLCADMRKGTLRNELEKLEADLAKGTPLREAVRGKQLPELYRQMLEVAAQSNDLPGMLTMLADHYQRRHVIATRLKGLMVYPALVLAGSFLLSCFLFVLVHLLVEAISIPNLFPPSSPPQINIIGLWLPPVLIGIAAAALFIALATPGVRAVLRWKIPAFKEASLSQVASALALMLRSGVRLDNALELTEQIESGTPAYAELARWRKRLAEGKGKFSEMAEGSKLFPPLFVWSVSQSNEDLPAGFQRAAELYQSRAAYRTDLMLYSAMPCAIIALALVILAQIQPALSFFIMMMKPMEM